MDGVRPANRSSGVAAGMHSTGRTLRTNRESETP